MMLGPLVPCELLGTLDDDDDACGFVRVERLRVRCERVEICDSEGCPARSIACKQCSMDCYAADPTPP